jgi:hypothetical protein
MQKGLLQRALPLCTMTEETWVRFALCFSLKLLLTRVLTAYLVKAELGSHRQEFMMVVDTGSSDTWVYNKDCDSKACLAHERYDHAKSTDYKRNGNSFNVTYGTGDSYGTFVTDRIKIGDFDLTTKFGLINEVSDIFAHFPLDGILALGFDFVSMSGERGFLEELVRTTELPCG